MRKRISRRAILRILRKANVHAKVNTIFNEGLAIELGMLDRDRLMSALMDVHQERKKVVRFAWSRKETTYGQVEISPGRFDPTTSITFVVFPGWRPSVPWTLWLRMTRTLSYPYYPTEKVETNYSERLPLPVVDVVTAEDLARERRLREFQQGVQARAKRKRDGEKSTTNDNQRKRFPGKVNDKRDVEASITNGYKRKRFPGKVNGGT